MDNAQNQEYTLKDHLETLPIRIHCQLEVTRTAIEKALPNTPTTVGLDLRAILTMFTAMDEKARRAISSLMEKPTIQAFLNPTTDSETETEDESAYDSAQERVRRLQEQNQMLQATYDRQKEEIKALVIQARNHLEMEIQAYREMHKPVGVESKTDASSKLMAIMDLFEKYVDSIHSD